MIAFLGPSLNNFSRLERRVAAIEKLLSGGATNLVDLLCEHAYSPASHHSVGMEAHCMCGFRPIHWLAWAEHVADIANRTK